MFWLTLSIFSFYDLRLRLPAFNFAQRTTSIFLQFKKATYQLNGKRWAEISLREQQGQQQFKEEGTKNKTGEES